jgi:Tol biopolymer transport system component
MKRRIAGRMITIVVAVVAVAQTGAAQTPGHLERESVGALGNETEGQAAAVSLSADGRFVAFHSDASDLVPGDTNQDTDVFVRDRQTGVVQRVSLTWNGMEARDDSACPALSADGRYVAFRSRAWNMYPGGANLGHPRWDVYVRDRQQGTTTRVTVSLSGGDPNGDSGCPAISGDGTKVVFASAAKNLVDSDGNGFMDVFLRDLVRNETLRLTRRGRAGGGNGDSGSPTISRDGRFVAFQSTALNLVPDGVPFLLPPPGFNNWTPHIYVHDLAQQATELVDVPIGSNLDTDWSVGPRLSADGRYVAFVSASRSLVVPPPLVYSSVYVRDRKKAKTWVASPSDVTQTDCGRPGRSFACIQGYIGPPDISDDGRFVAFASRSMLLLPANEWGGDQIYLFDNVGRRLRRLSVDPTGVSGDACSWAPDLSADGKVIAYSSKSTNLLPLDGLRHLDVYAQEWTCNDDGICRTLAACPAKPVDCAPATSSVLRLHKHPPGGTHDDRLYWSWTGSSASQPFVDPAGAGLYQICMYGRSLALDVAAPEAPRCGSSVLPCWRTQQFGYELLDPSGGLTRLTLSGAGGMRRILARGQGSLLDAPYLPVAGADGITVQLHDTGSGRCWGAAFPPAAIKRNVGGIAGTRSTHDGQLVAQLPAP